MAMRTVHTEWWTLDLPEEWQAEQEDDVIVVFDEDEVTLIEISTLHREEGDVNAADLSALTADLRERGLDSESVQIGPWSGEYFRYLDEDEACREWYLHRGSLLVFVTASCHVDHAGMDDGAVDEILSTLEPTG